ncbi:beta-ketoacyl-ACP synthase II [Cohnella thailandensis]|uniref:3-oxoacyl-[acyl-carrier-protein] synthase 2 n=1 Tax=Cohnella thailandensis TaxID=557557 RepID=A0A841T1I1_9BACL|nr:beta-ketoacyl-ACP synthase II [Cohnella thailandensis]MBB6634931.1 beta-ketoacyl-ACP synthase II [Cohnella thailandensis]MBP1975847.1 3-oxoacyl-[acyl-carrier-protein] synthase II [Cohnella thailandensis]
MFKERIVITGMGAVTPIGIGVPDYWRNLLSGKPGIGPITRFDAEGLPVRIAGEVKDFDPALYLPKKLIAQTDIFMQFAFAAAGEAIQSGGIAGMPPSRVGIVLGTALGGISTAAGTQEQITRSGSYRVTPHLVPKFLSNIAAAHIAIANGFKGPSYTVSTACSSGADAIGMAAMLLRAGQADAIVAAGAESILCALMDAGLSAARAMSARNEEPERASRPFDRGRDGFVMGEGAGALIVETLSSARARGAEILAELLGYANCTDAYHVTSPDPDGSGEIRCMRQALAEAGLAPEDIGYVNAHGTSTPLGDKVESQALREVFGEAAARIPVSSTKGATGHLMGAGGVTELIACIQAIREGVVPPTLNYEEPDPECDLDYVPNESREAKVDAAMSNSFGFGGQNTSIIVGRYRE